jgi:DNA repair exonuclease SbcCD ATPase subunit
MTDQELKDLIASFAVTHEKSVAEADRRFARLEAQLAETDAKFDKRLAETDAKLNKFFAETNAQLARTDAQLAKTDAQLAKTDAQLAKTDAQLKKLSDMVGGTVNNQGQAVEEFFYRSLAKRLRVSNMKFDVIYRNLTGHIKGLQDEFDIVLANGDTLAVFEVKTKAHTSLVETMLQRKIPNLRKVLPNFKNYKIYAGIASLVTYDELIEAVKKHGLFLLTQHGRHLEVVNEEVACF